MGKKDVLEEYCNSVKRLRDQCLNEGLTENEFKELYDECLETTRTENASKIKPRNKIFLELGKYKFIIISLIATICFVYNFKALYSCLICNLQEYIYPGLRFLRRLSIPIISLFPSLTELYHETCLIQNPFFTVVDMDCWPCSGVSNVREVQNPKPLSKEQNAPFIYQTNQQPVNIETIMKLYEKNKITFEKDHPKILKNNKQYVSPHEMFMQEQSGMKNLYIWKFNTMTAAQILRQVIPRPTVVPKFGQSTERFLIIDSSQDSFQVPDTECSFSFLILLKGRRTINLKPAEECKHQCKSLKVDLKESYLLWYNWWYWRPVVQPAIGNVTLIAHVGSYC